MNDDILIRRFMMAMDAAQAGAARVQIDGRGSLEAAFPVTALATASIGAAALAVAEYIGAHLDRAPSVSVDRRLASFWFGTSLRGQGWAPPDVRDAVTGDYATLDGWIRLHANAPHHRRAALRVLGVETDKQAVKNAVARWRATDLEAAIVDTGGCAAAMRTLQDWSVHPQGVAVSAEPLFHVSPGTATRRPLSMARADRPLGDLKVLDLTRVLAGPVSTRFLAGYGAHVLRIDPPFWTEPGMVPEVTPGKRCAVLDLREQANREALISLLAQADVLVHGYRADALERMGLGECERQQIRPGLIDVSLNAYGWTGPWKSRRGFDSLVQMSNGIAHAGMMAFKRRTPTPLPVQALDQATGYLMAAAVLRGLTRSLHTGRGSTTRLSLARTAALLISEAPEPASALDPEVASDLAPEQENTVWGPARRLKPPCRIAGVPFCWDLPASELGSAHPHW